MSRTTQSPAHGQAQAAWPPPTAASDWDALTLDAMVRLLRRSRANHVLANTIGAVCARRGEVRRACRYLRLAIAYSSGADQARYHYNLGCLLREDAVAVPMSCFERAHALARAIAAPCVEIAWLYHDRLRRYDRAIAWFVEALARDPHDLRSCCQIYAVLLRDCSGRVAARELTRLLRSTDVQRPTWARAIARALEMRNRVDEAISWWSRLAAEGVIDDREAVYALARCYEQQGDLARAIAKYERLTVQGELTGEAVGGYVKVLLRAGREEAARAFTIARDVHAARKGNGTPAWDGTSADGRAFVIDTWPEGQGDAIMFSRVANLLHAQGAASVTIECQRPLQSLLASIPGVDRAVLYRDRGPTCDHREHIIKCLLKIPRAAWSAVPMPYVRVTPPYRDRWRRLIPDAGGMKVGLVWSAGPASGRGDQGRSMPLEALAPLLAVPGIDWYALQKGTGRDQLHDSGWRDGLHDVASACRDYLDTAAAVERLDCVVSVDTSVPHVSGALGKPTALLVPHYGDWRWGTARDHTFWYPTHRLFRQPRADDWDNPVAEVVQWLERLRRGMALNPSTPTGSALY